MMADAAVPALPSAVEQLLDTICREQNQPQPSFHLRRELCSLEEKVVLDILRKMASSKIRCLDSYLRFMINKSKTNNGSPVKRACVSPLPSRSPTPSLTRLWERNSAQIPMELDSAGGSEPQITPQQEALNELEYRKSFLILNYLGGRRLEEVLPADQIRGLSNLSMEKFEVHVWDKVGCREIEERHRAKYLCWDSGKTHVYHCYVYPDRSYRFKGPYLTEKSNFLQRTLGDDNVLMVKFAEGIDERSSTSRRFGEYYDNFSWLIKEGILVGLHRYRFFVFKDGGKEEKKKDPTTSPVKCYFVRMESDASIDNSDYVFHGKTIRQARAAFMNVDTLPTLSKYMARFSLMLSKTIRGDVDLSGVNIEKISDVPCKDTNGNYFKDKDGKCLILTDGTGFISEDLALKCQQTVSKEKYSNSNNVENLLIQFRLFYNGGAVKGTFLVNKKLPPGTMQVRPSMIKVDFDATSSWHIKNSLEIVGTSNRPKRTCLSRTLIALLTYGGVPKEFFLNILNKSLEEAQGALKKEHAAYNVAMNHGDMDDFVAARMILSGIPLEEPYLQYNLRKWMSDEKSGLRGGKLPISESYYLMGTVDPTGHLESDEVCIILENGHMSGNVLVYRNPGLHFGDIHVLRARYVEALEDYVGNAKYAIFFPCKGPRSLADEIAGGDYDGDLYFVSRNPELLANFKAGEPWVSSSPSCNVPTQKPCEFSDEDLENELFKLFLTTRFNPSYTMSTAADSWQAIMDRLLTLGDDRNDETEAMKRNMNQLIDIYYDAIDAPKTGGEKTKLPDDLKAELYPHYMEKKEESSYKSTSILGLIHDRVIAYGEEDQAKIEVKKHPWFTGKASESCLMKWQTQYSEYRQDMTAALKQSSHKDAKNEAADEVIKKYKEILYGAPSFEDRRRCRDAIFKEACAIYEVCYDYASSHDAARCSFAWKVAGPALCNYFIKIKGETQITCSAHVLKKIFG